MNKRKYQMTVVLLSFCISALTGCYRAPQEGEYSVIPATNNPAVVGTHGSDNLLPASGF